MKKAKLGLLLYAIVIIFNCIFNYEWLWWVAILSLVLGIFGTIAVFMFLMWLER